MPVACGGQARFEGYRTQGGADGGGLDHGAPRLPMPAPHCGHGAVRWMRRWGWRATASVPACGAWPAASARRCRLPRRPTTLAAAARGARCRPARCARSPRRSARGASRRWPPRSPRPGRTGCHRCRGRRRTRLLVAMDGVRILGTDGAGREVKVGVVRAGAADRQRRAAGARPAMWPGWSRRRRSVPAWRWRRTAAARKAAARSPSSAMARRGSGTWPPSTSPQAVQIVDWFHASERVWALGTRSSGRRRRETTAWVERQLARLAQGRRPPWPQEWRRCLCVGDAAAVRDAQVTYFTNQAPRMAYDRIAPPAGTSAPAWSRAPAST